MTIGLNTIPRGATPILDANRVILNEDPIPEVLPTLIHSGNVLTGPDLHPDPASPDQDLVEGMVITLGVTTV